MYHSITKISHAVAVTAAWVALLGGQTATSAWAQHAGHDHAGHDHSGGTARAPAAPQAPHGGQISKTAFGNLEAVYQPRETRVYLYDPSMRPVGARGVQGRAVMQVRGHAQPFRFELKYVAPPAASPQQDYLVAVADVSRVRDGDMTVTFQLTNLPDPRQPQATFTQTFALSKIAPRVTVAAVTQADRAAIARQKVCVVSGGKLGSMGAPIKVLIGDRAVYLCCKGCIGKIQKNPEAYLPKATAPGPRPNATAPAAQITVATATAADQAAIARQQVCVVSSGKLGSMGVPVKVLIGDRAVFLCCKGCVAKVQKNPAAYLAKAAQLRGGR